MRPLDLREPIDTGPQPAKRATVTYCVTFSPWAGELANVVALPRPLTRRFPTRRHAA
jgi:hypothetical protein